MTPRALLVGAVLLAWTRPAVAVAAAGNGEDTPEASFRAGRLELAAEALAALAPESEDRATLLLEGRLALWKNRLDEAVAALEKAGPPGEGEDDSERLVLLAEAAYRRLDFGAAAELLRTAGRESRAAQLASLAGRPPYAIEGPERGVVDFVQTDPLPLVELSVNGSEPLLFLVDTGGGELILDPETAERVGAERFGTASKVFAADARAEVEYAAVDSVSLGPFVVSGVPVGLLPTGRFAAVAGGRTVHGVLGTTLLRQFRFTLDYPGGRLVLERASPGGSAARTEDAARIPFWLVGDHLIVASGCLGDADSLMLLLDTGLAGGALAATDSAIAEAGVDLAGAPELGGVGGGGAVSVRPFVLSRACLGAVEGHELTGFAGAFPASLEYRYGFRLAGLLSHGFLRPYAVTFDFTAMSVGLQRPATPAP